MSNSHQFRSIHMALLLLGTIGIGATTNTQTLEARLDCLERAFDHHIQYTARNYVSVGCKATTAGTSYSGPAYLTGDNKECQRWDQQFPHTHSWTGIANFCHNPDATPGGPWCYTTDPDTRWQFCDIRSCHAKTDCKLTSGGLEYGGKLSVSAAGTDCTPWNQLPSGVDSVSDDMFPHDDTVAAASNYCRNPTNDLTGPYCYDQQGQKRYCDIKYCHSEQFEYSTPYSHGVQSYIYLPVDRFPTNGNQLHFRVKAKNDVHVTLTPDGGDGYEVVIGGWANTRSVLRKCHQCTNLVEMYHSPLDENEYKEFWIFWESGRFYVGSGRVLFVDTFLTYDDPNPECAEVVGISTGFGSSGEWILHVGDDCRQTVTGQHYAGRVSFTADGLKCQRWDSQTPTSHNYTTSEMFLMDGSVEAAGDFCRNPSGSLGGPWCYQLTGGWNYCDIPFCEP